MPAATAEQKTGAENGPEGAAPTGAAPAAALKTAAWPEPGLVEALKLLRLRKPLVHCLTDSVGRELMANAVLALGGSPAMIADIAEVEQFTATADALVVNLGSLTAPKAAAMRRAAAIALSRRKPWLLDPTAVGGLSPRADLARELLLARPSVIKGNASEIMSLAGEEGRGRGADSGLASEEALAAAAALAARLGCVVAVTGAVDYITDAETTLAVPGGHELMARVTGTGCALGAVMGAFLGAGLAPLRAATAGAAVYAFAGRQAGAEAGGPGSFVPALLDHLYRLDGVL
jgi:hydroxyethylthiazole kinase